jgi:hypothetical protein
MKNGWVKSFRQARAEYVKVTGQEPVTGAQLDEVRDIAKIIHADRRMRTRGGAARLFRSMK